MNEDSPFNSKPTKKSTRIFNQQDAPMKESQAHLVGVHKAFKQKDNGWINASILV
jgi:hypothetical protein